LNCEGVIRELSSYLDGELDPAVQKELERHLGDCGECALIVDQTKKTVQFFCNSEPVELPAEVRSRLREALRRKIRPSSA
jgi:anti-sigma factor RsiW